MTNKIGRNVSYKYILFITFLLVVFLLIIKIEYDCKDKEGDNIIELPLYLPGT
jgi:hypothetical protein